MVPVDSSIKHQVGIIGGQTATVEDVLHPVGMFTWILEDNRGNRIGGINAKLAPMDGNSIQEPQEKQLPSNGIVEFTAIPGNYVLSAQPPNFQPISIQVQLIAGQPGDLTTKAQPTSK